MAETSFFMASKAKLWTVVILQLLVIACGNEQAFHVGGSTTPAPAAGAQDNSKNPLMGWVNQEMQNFQFSSMAAKDTDGGLDPKLQDAEKKKKVIVVAADGSGNFKTITDAIKSVPAGNTGRVIVKIKSGTYKEKVLIDKNKPFITFYGNPSSKPTIVYDGTAAKYGTFYSATVCVMSNYFMAVNIIFQNSAPKPKPGSQGGQAVALRIAGERAAFYSCDFIGYQDTLHDDSGLHYFKDCTIQGTVDFIFGDGRSYYTGCNLVSVNDAPGVSTMVAQGREKKGDMGGFSFVHCKVTGRGKQNMNRAWRGYSRVVFAYCYLDTVVTATGWDDHGISDHSGLYYGEYQCSGPGSSTAKRASYALVLNEGQAKPFIDPSFVKASQWLLPPPKL
ncbi:putative pectinesterase 63 [Nymphaea colorata]|nr:putative pectinesterase 63 [Nymphaea colorata]